MTAATYRLTRADQTKSPALHTPWWWSGSTVSFVAAYTRAVNAGRTAWDLATYLGAPSAADLRRAVLALRKQGHDLPTPRPPLPADPEPVPEPVPEPQPEQDWLSVLELEVKKTSQTQAAIRIGYQSSSTVWMVLNRTAGDKARQAVAERVRHVLIERKPLSDLLVAPTRPTHTQKAPPPGTARRCCLKCRQPFTSFGPGNRLCRPCRCSNLNEGEYGGIF